MPIVFARAYSQTIGWALAGLAIGPPGVVLLFTKAWVSGVFMAALGMPFFLVNVALLIRRPPRLRVDAEGLWFGVGQVVPWREVKSVYLSTVPVVAGGGVFSAVARHNRALSFDFHDPAATRRRLPLTMRWRAGVGVGHLDLSGGTFVDDIATVAARINVVQAELSEP